jgi:dTDP-4-amino-4,6-dideoxygalactose transaminase
MARLALFGGPKSVTGQLPVYRTTGEAEEAAVLRVMRGGVLSAFLGAWSEEFRGGPEVRAFESEWAGMFGCAHAVTVNSATSGLIAAMGALGISPGDEVIVPPYTMSATAMAPLFYGAIPVFADVEPDYFCLDPDSVAAAISPRTKAIIAVNLFGQVADLKKLRELADRYGIALVEDNAQAPLASQGDRLAGTVGHIGVFSLNYHKHFHTGEGGVCVTADRGLADRLAMIRNHAENVADKLGKGDLVNLIGHNFRMTELSAAIGREQLKRAEGLVRRRIEIAERLTEGLRALKGIVPPQVRPGCRHVYYVWAGRFLGREIGVDRELFAKALVAEGVPLSTGYVRPLYLLPVFQERIALGRDGFPFNMTQRRYEKGLCPVTERLYESELFLYLVCSYDPTDEQVDEIIAAFHKVYDAREELVRAVA